MFIERLSQDSLWTYTNWQNYAYLKYHVSFIDVLVIFYLAYHVSIVVGEWKVSSASSQEGPIPNWSQCSCWLARGQLGLKTYYLKYKFGGIGWFTYFQQYNLTKKIYLSRIDLASSKVLHTQDQASNDLTQLINWNDLGVCLSQTRHFIVRWIYSPSSGLSFLLSPFIFWYPQIFYSNYLRLVTWTLFILSMKLKAIFVF